MDRIIVDYVGAKRSNSSMVWKYFGFYKTGDTVDKNNTVCKLCKAEKPYKGYSTSNMMAHLTTFHNEVVCPKGDDKKQVSMDMFTSMAKPMPKDGKMYKDCTKFLAEWIIADLIPLSSVESEEFRALIKALNPRYLVPCRKTITAKVIPEIYSDVKKKLIAELADQTALGITTDCWTSLATQSYITVTAHYITGSWDLQSAVLLTRHLPGSHTAENLAQALSEAFNEWELSDKHITGNSDNARNIINAWSILNKTSIGCVGHVLNLAVKKALDINSVAPVLARARRLVTYFHHSALASQKLREKQILLKLNQKKLIQDVDTRWNSTLDMITSILDQQLAICAVLIESSSKHKDMSLETKDVKILEKLSDVLQPFKEITIKLSGESYSTVSVVAPVMHQLLNKTTKADPDDDKFLVEFKKTLHSDLKTRYKTAPVREYLLVASTIDPRFRHLSFVGQDEKEEIYNKVKEEMCELNQAPTMEVPAVEVPAASAASVKHEVQSVTPEIKREVNEALQGGIDGVINENDLINATSAKKAKFSFDINDLICHENESNAPLSLPERAAKELDSYLQNPIVATKLTDPSFNPIQWWKNHETAYPLMSKIVRKFMCVPATSTPSERVFSTAGNILTKKRASLLPETVDRMVFLHANYARFK